MGTKGIVVTAVKGQVGILWGGNGDDTMEGGLGGDKLAGGAGDDTYYVNNSNDMILFENAYSGKDTICSSLKDSSLLNIWGAAYAIENLTLLDGAINGRGNGLNNVLTGNASDNTLDGGFGTDTLIGGAGADRFVFSTALSKPSTQFNVNCDVIKDFSAAEGDTIVLDHLVFKSLTGLDSLVGHLRYLDGQKKGDGDDFIVYNPGSGALYYDATGGEASASAMVKFATLENKPVVLHGEQFIVI